MQLPCHKSNPDDQCTYRGLEAQPPRHDINPLARSNVLAGDWEQTYQPLQHERFPRNCMTLETQEENQNENKTERNKTIDLVSWKGNHDKKPTPSLWCAGRSHHAGPRSRLCFEPFLSGKNMEKPITKAQKQGARFCWHFYSWMNCCFAVCHWRSSGKTMNSKFLLSLDSIDWTPKSY